MVTELATLCILWYLHQFTKTANIYQYWELTFIFSPCHAETGYIYYFENSLDPDQVAT